MKKSGKKFTLSNRWLYTLISLGILLLISAGAYAWGTSSPSVFGHSVGELDLTGISRVVTAEGNSAGVYDLSGGNIAASTSIYSYGRICAGMSSGDCTGSGGTLITSSGISTGSVSAGSMSTSYLDVQGSSTAIRANAPSGTGVIGFGSYAGLNGYGTASGSYGVRGAGASYDFYAYGAGTNYRASSSIRWKNNISEIPNALSKILALRGVYYDWNKEHGGEHDMGFIAEEVGEFVPEIVSYDDETNNSNWYIENGKKKLYATGLDYGALTPMLVEAIKEQQKIIDSQEEKLNKICTKLPSLCE